MLKLLYYTLAGLIVLAFFVVKGVLIFPTFLILFGLLFICVSIGFRNQQKALLSNSVTVDAKISNIIKEKSNSSTSYIPVFEFTFNENIYTIKYNVGYPSPKFYIGQTVQVNFNPEYSDEVVLTDDWLTENFYKIFFIIGISCVLVSFVLFRSIG